MLHRILAASGSPAAGSMEDDIAQILDSTAMLIVNVYKVDKNVSVTHHLLF